MSSGRGAAPKQKSGRKPLIGKDGKVKVELTAEQKRARAAVSAAEMKRDGGLASLIKDDPDPRGLKALAEAQAKLKETTTRAARAAREATPEDGEIDESGQDRLKSGDKAVDTTSTRRSPPGGPHVLPPKSANVGEPTKRSSKAKAVTSKPKTETRAKKKSAGKPEGVTKPKKVANPKTATKLKATRPNAVSSKSSVTEARSPLPAPPTFDWTAQHAASAEKYLGQLHALDTRIPNDRIMVVGRENATNDKGGIFEHGWSAVVNAKIACSKIHLQVYGLEKATALAEAREAASKEDTQSPQATVKPPNFAYTAQHAATAKSCIAKLSALENRILKDRIIATGDKHCDTGIYENALDAIHDAQFACTEIVEEVEADGSEDTMAAFVWWDAHIKSNEVGKSSPIHTALVDNGPIDITAASGEDTAVQTTSQQSNSQVWDELHATAYTAEQEALVESITPGMTKPESPVMYSEPPPESIPDWDSLGVVTPGAASPPNADGDIYGSPKRSISQIYDEQNEAPVRSPKQLRLEVEPDAVQIVPSTDDGANDQTLVSPAYSTGDAPNSAFSGTLNDNVTQVGTSSETGRVASETEGLDADILNALIESTKEIVPS
ncbi:hypothetical protein LTR22_021330 [Elasticomyces elasticus]|nr:hypothetical protein LTR22_021330 [Elasticomyces elasticus]KAK4909282.1 hypothetical protein LTR49_021952 [Elasticomyces elasticus]KAK5753560.1 hypothetical protein LTS12_016400 [Elasticomyces elasticus]